MLDRLPVGGEGDAQAMHGWLTVRNPVNVNTRSGEREHGFRRT